MSAIRQTTRHWTSAFLAAAIGLVAPGGAWAAQIAFKLEELQTHGSLQVSVPGVVNGGAISLNYTFDGRNLSPPISWSEGPPQTRSFVVLMQDADGVGLDGSAQWLVYDISPAVLTLPRGMRNVASPSNPLGASQGRNVHASLGYTGPQLAVGEPAHHYHLQVFALDRLLHLRAGAELPAVLRAMGGHVVARGELIVTYATPAPNAPHDRRKKSSTPEPTEPLFR